MKIRLASDIQTDSIVDGTGIRAVVWTQGCSHNCPGCHNPSTHDFNGGDEVDIEDVKERLSELEAQDGVTFSGGDPFFQPEACAELAKYIHDLGMNVWCYTGFLFEDLLKASNKKRAIREFLDNIDILVDGPFIISKKSYSAKFRGSTNQRIIDVKKSLEEGYVIEALQDEEEQDYNFGRYREKVFI